MTKPLFDGYHMPSGEYRYLDRNITQEHLKQLLHYSPATGVFTWKQRTTNRIKIGDVAGHCSNGYTYIGIYNFEYKAHRLAWLYMTGRWPAKHVDHINGNRVDNRWRNLRDADACINQQNRRVARKGNPTGLIGAMVKGKKFASYIHANGKRIYLGTFASAKEAHAAYIKAKRVLHPGGQL